MNKKLIAALIILVIVFGAGFYSGKKLAAKTGAPANQENTYQAGWNAAEARLKQRGQVPDSAGIKALTGTIDSVSGNTVTLKDVFSPDPLADPSLATRTVQVAQDTKIYQIVQKDPAQFQQEVEAFKKANQANPAAGSGTGLQQMAVPPQQSEQKEISLSDIKAGQRITVMSNDPIGDKKQFTATQISVLLGNLTPVTTPALTTPPAATTAPAPVK